MIYIMATLIESALKGKVVAIVTEMMRDDEKYRSYH